MLHRIIQEVMPRVIPEKIRMRLIQTRALLRLYLPLKTERARVRKTFSLPSMTATFVLEWRKHRY